MHFDKKQLEILLINYFRSSYNDFPNGQLTPSESPDFILKLKNRREIGIELTRLNPVNKNVLFEGQHAGIQIREEIIEIARGLFEQTSVLKLFVKFLFSEEIQIQKEKLLMTAIQAVNLIRSVTSNKKTDSFFRENISGNNLPDGIVEILIVNHPALTVSVWERVNNLGISMDVVDDIRQAIKKKDEKLRIYHRQQLNFYWLLITIDRLRGVRNYKLHEKIMNHEFHSGFQQVFLFDLVKSEIYQLI